MDTSYLSQQVTTIIERLHGFFDEIGVPSHERDSRESELFSALSETLHNQLNLVAKEKHDLTEKAQTLIKTIRQMERSLDDSRPQSDYESEEDGLKVTFPLLACMQRLKEKHHTIAKLHRERFEQVKKLVEALQSYASHLEPSFVKIKLPPTAPNAEVPPTFDLSQTYVSKLDQEFMRVYDEYNKRIATVSQCADEIISLWSELGTPQAQVDSQIVEFARDAPEQLGLHQEDIKRLLAKREKLVSEKQQRERRLKELRATVEGLWDRLGVDESERRQFLAANRGCGLRQINEFEDELARLNELKRQNLHIFVEDARFKLQALWDDLYYSEEEMLSFTPAFSDVYSDALLSAHEQEITRLEALKEQRAPILAVIDKHRSIIKDREELEKSSQDASRLMMKGAKGEKRDPGKLLREEKMRKRITKELPKVEAELRKTLEAWEDEYGRPFCVHGERYLDELEASQQPRAAPPTRSKTPANQQPVREAPKSAGRAAQSVSRSGTLRGAPPPRSKTPTMVRNGNTSSHVSTANIGRAVNNTTSTSKLSPSKIPGASRLPMSAIRDGNNSPERRHQSTRSQTAIGHREDDYNKTVRMGPPRAPPPKMKDLFPPTPTPGGNKENGPGEAFDRGIQLVRNIEPEDPYVLRASHSVTDSNYRTSNSTHSQSYPRSYASSHASYDSHHSAGAMGRQEYPVAPPSRQASNTSSVMSGSAVSGSENWETYTDNSECDENDAADAYYARVKARELQQYQQQQQMQSQRAPIKRPLTASANLGLPAGMVKRVREREVEGSASEWTDDGAMLGETF